MAFIITGFLLAACLITAKLIWQNRERTRLQRELALLDLRPNCLLTRHPILLLSRPPRRFELFSRAEISTRFLREHGYDAIVATWDGKGNGPANSNAQALEAFQGNEEKFHIVALPELKIQGSKIVSQLHSSVPGRIASFTNFRKATQPSASDTWATEKELLSLAISLAERDCATEAIC